MLYMCKCLAKKNNMSIMEYITGNKKPVVETNDEESDI